jgi:glycine/D-amino acid oxidase-like deaminating enzyme
MLHPEFKAAPYWYDDFPPASEPCEVPERCDVAIVGAGYCGLSAALELARNGTAVTVLDAEDLGAGASGRNVGFVSASHKLLLRYARAASDRLEATLDSFRHIEALIARNGFDADYERCGRLVVASTRGAFEGFRNEVDQLNAIGVHARLVAPHDIAAEIGGGRYCGAIVIDEGGALNPAKFHRALRSAARSSGAVIASNVRVERIGRQAGRFELETKLGSIRAEQVFVATNAVTGALAPFMRDRLVPVVSQVVATEPLPQDVIRRVMPSARPWGDTNRVTHFARLSTDRTRILFAGRAKFGQCSERESARLHHANIVRTWPELRDVRISHAWHGFIAFTFDLQPHMAEREGVHYAGGCQGAGVAMMTYLGHQTALKLLRRCNAPHPFEAPGFPTMRLYRGRPWFVPAVGAWYRLRDAADRFAGR